MEELLLKLKNPWVVIGFVGQFTFMMRFIIQWIASEKAKQSVIPVAFWYISLAGSALVLVYAISITDPVFILGQSIGFVVYIRNLIFIHRRKEAQA